MADLYTNTAVDLLTIQQALRITPVDVLTDENAEPWYDEFGVRIQVDPNIISLTPTPSQVAGSRFKIGCAVPPIRFVDSSYPATYEPGLWEQHAAFADIFVFGESLPANLQATQGVWDTSKLTAMIAKAEALGKKWRFHPVIYPAHDFPWASSGTITSGTYKSLIDAHINNVLSLCNASSCQDIVVTNEIFDGNNTNPGGYRSNPWYTASIGQPSSAPNAGSVSGYDIPDWVAYLFIQARAKCPSKTLLLGHDLLEQLYDSYHTNQAANVLAFLTKALAAGIPIDGLMMQGHVLLDFALNVPLLQSFMASVKALGLKITFGEIDVRTSGGTFASYTTVDYDLKAADLVSQLLMAGLPYIDVGQPVMVWMISDNSITSWTRGERTCLLDTHYQPKPLYAAFRDSIQQIVSKGL